MYILIICSSSLPPLLDIILISADRILNVYSRHYSPSYLGHHGIKHNNKNVRRREREREREREDKIFLFVGVIVKDITCCCYDNWFSTTIPVSGTSTQAG